MTLILLLLWPNPQPTLTINNSNNKCWLLIIQKKVAKPLRDWTRDLAADADFFLLKPTQPSSTRPTPAQVVNWNLADTNFFFHKAGAATQLHSAHTSPSCQLKCTHKTKKWRRQRGSNLGLWSRLHSDLPLGYEHCCVLLSHFKYFVYLTIDPSILWTMYTLIFAKSNLTFISTLNIHKTILWQFPEFLEKF